MNKKMKSLLKKINNYLYNGFIKSTESKILLVLMIINILLLLYNRVYFLIIVIKVIIYLAIASQMNCSIYGDCRISAILLFVIPIGAIVLTILDIVGYFTKFKIRLKAFLQGERFLEPSYLISEDDEEIEEKIQKIQKIDETIINITQ